MMTTAEAEDWIAFKNTSLGCTGQESIKPRVISSGAPMMLDFVSSRITKKLSCFAPWNKGAISR
jgi:hypothetical protein